MIYVLKLDLKIFFFEILFCIISNGSKMLIFKAKLCGVLYIFCGSGGWCCFVNEYEMKLKTRLKFDTTEII